MLRQWLRNKLARPVYVDCYTTSQPAYEVARIKSAARYIPKWWKNISTTLTHPLINEGVELYGNTPTMRGCAGFIDLFKNSFALPLWSDVSILVYPEGQEGYYWKFADNMSEAEEHSPVQRGAFMDPKKYQHIKLKSPWYLRCEEPIEFLFFDPFWLRKDEETVLIPPGIVNYKYQTTTSINMFIRKLPGENRTVSLEFNTPLVFLTPLTTRKVILRHHIVSEEKLSQLRRNQVAFVNSYQKAKAVTKAEEI